MRRSVSLCAAALLMAPCGSAFADINFNGFASIYMGTTLDDDESLYGFDDSFDFKQGSLFGLQATADLSDGLTATAQMIARGTEDFDVGFEWAYLTYSVNDKLDISVGRLRVPFFKYSEFLDVGYAFPWARTPQDVYDVDFNTFEGIRFNYTTYAGDWEFAWQGVYGGLSKKLSISGQSIPADIEDIFNLSIDATYDWISFRLGYTIADVSFDAGLEGLAPLFASAQAADDFLADEDNGYFGSAGVFVDYNDWLVNAEVIEYEAEDNFSSNISAYYMMVGKRINDFTVAYTYSEQEDTNDYSVVSSIPNFIPNPDPSLAFCGPTAQDLVRNCLISPQSENSTHNIVVRWNFHPAASMTFDYTNREYDLNNNQPSDESDKLFTVGVDMVF